MITNILLLFFTIFLAYFGYKYNAVLFFVLSLVREQVINMIYKIRTPSMVHNIDDDNYQLKFLFKNKEYIMIIPNMDLTLKNKYMALSGKTNKTEHLLKVMGPFENFFGSIVTPRDMGLTGIKIWKNTTKFSFEENEIIDFNNFGFDKFNESETDISDTEDGKDNIKDNIKDTEEYDKVTIDRNNDKGLIIEEIKETSV